MYMYIFVLIRKNIDRQTATRWHEKLAYAWRQCTQKKENKQ